MYVWPWVARILLESGRLSDAVNNPQAFIDHASEIINAAKREFLVYGDGSDGSGVKYVKLDDAVYEIRRFAQDDLMEVFSSNVHAVEKQDKTLFSHIVIDSNSGPERAFAQACEDSEDVLFFIKLPRWFQIETPVGPYNPDWAVAYRNDTTLYFVAETKKTGNGDHVQLDLLRPIEDLRIECGKRHFKNFEQVKFRVVICAAFTRSLRCQVWTDFWNKMPLACVACAAYQKPPSSLIVSAN